jgi:hypothetical protein
MNADPVVIVLCVLSTIGLIMTDAICILGLGF